MKSIDFKSAVIGLLLGVCVMLVLGAGGIGTTNIGRYRIVRVGTSSTTCFVIDSATGRVWRKNSYVQGGYMGSPEEWDNKAKKK